MHAFKAKILLQQCLVACALSIFSTGYVWSENIKSENTKPQTKDVIKNYADIGLAAYEDSLTRAKALQTAVNELIAKPSQETHDKAKATWKAARIPYMQTEVFRFGNSIVDDWEGKVNSWPLDEGLIDYVAPSYGDKSDQNGFYTANVIANKTISAAGKTIDASKITKDLLANELQEAGKIEANVATGYHAIEFLLWGQDTNGTGPGAGKRPFTDFDVKNCTGGNCDRRADYLKLVTDLLVEDLEWMVGQWQAEGAIRKKLFSGENKDALVTIFTGMGSLSYGELAGERMKLGLMLHDPEEEQDCFSDNTHNSHYYDALGIQNIYLGRYKRIDGTLISGPGASDLVKAASPDVDKDIQNKLNSTIEAMTTLVKRAEGGEAYDQMLAEDNEAGNAVIQKAIDALVTQTKAIEKGVASLNLTAIKFEGSESLDSPDKVKK